MEKSSVEAIEEHVLLFEFFAWSNENIPDNVMSFLEFHEKVKEIKEKHTGPILVHCRYVIIVFSIFNKPNNIETNLIQ